MADLEIDAMNRTQIANCFLLASAFVLGGLLLVKLDGRLTSSAYADQVVSEDTLTFMTARTKSDDEALFMIDNINARLLIFQTDVNRKKMAVVESVDLSARFGTGSSRRRGNR